MRNPEDPRRDSDTTGVGERPYEFEEDVAAEQGETVGAARHVARGGPEEPDLDGETTDGEYGPGSD